MHTLKKVPGQTNYNVTLQAAFTLCKRVVTCLQSHDYTQAKSKCAVH